MFRIFRIAFAASALLSLLLCMGVIAWWIRGQYAYDIVRRNTKLTLQEMGGLKTGLYLRWFTDYDNGGHLYTPDPVQWNRWTFRPCDFDEIKNIGRFMKNPTTSWQGLIHYSWPGGRQGRREEEFHVPYWMVVMVTAVLPIAWAAHLPWAKRVRRRREMRI